MPSATRRSEKDDESSSSSPPPRLPSSFIKAAAKIHAAEEADATTRLGHCKALKWNYLLIVVLGVVAWATAKVAPVLSHLLIVLLALLILRAIHRYRKWRVIQRIDSPEKEEIVVAKVYKIMRIHEYHHHHHHASSTGGNARAPSSSRPGLGLRFEEDDVTEQVFVSNISVDSPFQPTLLRIGMQILTINGEVPQSAFEARSMIHQVEEWQCVKLTALVSPATHQRTKIIIDYESQQRRRRGRHGSKSRGGERVGADDKKRAPGGKKNKNAPGGIPVNSSSEETADLDYSSRTTTSVEEEGGGETTNSRTRPRYYQQKSPTGGSSFSEREDEDDDLNRSTNSSSSSRGRRFVEGPLTKFKVHKRLSKTPLGLSLLRTPEGRFKVSAIEPGSKFDETDLSVGMIVETINGITVNGRDSLPAVMRVLYKTVGDIEVEARSIIDTSSMALSTRTSTMMTMDSTTSHSMNTSTRREDPESKKEEEDLLVEASSSTTTADSATTMTRAPPTTSTSTSRSSSFCSDDYEDDLGINLIRDESTGKYYVRDWSNDPEEEEDRTDETLAVLLKSGLQLLAVNGVSVTGKPKEAVLSLLRNKKAEDVRLTLSCDHHHHHHHAPPEDDKNTNNKNEQHDDDA